MVYKKDELLSVLFNNGVTITPQFIRVISVDAGICHVINHHGVKLNMRIVDSSVRGTKPQPYEACLLDTHGTYEEGETEWYDHVLQRFLENINLESFTTEQLSLDNPKQKTGWISPDGKYYHAPYRHHDQAAFYICSIEFGLNFAVFVHARDHLFDLGWIQIRGNGDRFNPMEGLTCEQLDTLNFIRNMHGQKPYKENQKYNVISFKVNDPVVPRRC